jgi:predicted dehydrogenase
MIREGKIGEVRRVLAGSHGNPALMLCYAGEEPVPVGLDWNMWMGPAPYRPYHYDVKRHWRRWMDFGGGGIADRGAHHFDVAHWGLGFDLAEPVWIYPPDGKERPFLTYQYENGVEMLVHYDLEKRQRLSQGVTFVGSEGEIRLDAISVTSEYRPESLRLAYRGEKVGRRIIPDNPHGTGHYGNFLECVRSRRRPNADVEIASHSTSVCILGNMAHWLGRPLEWDPHKRLFTNDPEANRMISRNMREPWSL